MKLNKQIVLFSKIKSIDIANFTKHMSVMIKSGITISESLDTLIHQTKSSKMGEVITKIAADVDNGASLALAMGKHPKVFDKFYVSIIEIGEESGTLSSNLEYLSKKLRKDDKLHKKVKQALFYPIMVISAALIVGLGVGIFILPKMAEIFSSMDVELPFATQLLLGFAEVLKQYNILIVVGIISFIIIFRLLIAQKAIKPIWQKFLMKLPVIGPFLIIIETTSFCRNLGIMMKSGLPISRALEILYNTTENTIFKRSIYRLQKSVTSGKPLGEELSKINLLPLMATRMISVGEKSGNLNDMLLYLSDYYEEEANSLAKGFSTVLEPAILLFIGLIVAVVAMAVISPIYQMTSGLTGE